MAKFKCLKECKSKETGEIFKPNVEYDLTIKFVETLEKNIEDQEKYKGTGPYFERVDVKPKTTEKKEEEASE